MAFKGAFQPKLFYYRSTHFHDQYFFTACFLYSVLISMKNKHISCPSEFAVHQQNGMQQLKVTAPDPLLQRHTCLISDNQACQRIMMSTEHA